MRLYTVTPPCVNTHPHCLLFWMALSFTKTFQNIWSLSKQLWIPTVCFVRDGDWSLIWSDLLCSFRPDGVELWERSEVAVVDGASLQAPAGGKGLPGPGWQRCMLHERGRLPSAFASVQRNFTRTSGYMEIRWNTYNLISVCWVN